MHAWQWAFGAVEMAVTYKATDWWLFTRQRTSQPPKNLVQRCCPHCGSAQARITIGNCRALWHSGVITDHRYNCPCTTCKRARCDAVERGKANQKAANNTYKTVPRIPESSVLATRRWVIPRSIPCEFSAPGEPKPFAWGGEIVAALQERKRPEAQWHSQMAKVAAALQQRIGRVDTEIEALSERFRRDGENVESLMRLRREASVRRCELEAQYKDILQEMKEMQTWK